MYENVRHVGGSYEVLNGPYTSIQGDTQYHSVRKYEQHFIPFNVQTLLFFPSRCTRSTWYDVRLVCLDAATWKFIVLYCCIVLYCTAVLFLYCTVLYCVVSRCIVLYYIVYCIVLFCIVLYCIVLYCIVLYCIVLYCIVLYCIVLYCIVLYCIVLYCTHERPTGASL